MRLLFPKHHQKISQNSAKHRNWCVEPGPGLASLIFQVHGLVPPSSHHSSLAPAVPSTGPTLHCSMGLGGLNPGIGDDCFAQGKNNFYLPM